MTQYVQITGGAPAKITRAGLKAQNPGVMFPKSPTLSLLAGYNIYPLVEVSPPSYDEATEKVVEGDATEGPANTWTQTWSTVGLSQGEQDDYTEAARRIASRAALRNDTEVRQLLRATPAQIDTYIDNNVTNIASAKEVIKIIARALAVVSQESI